MAAFGQALSRFFHQFMTKKPLSHEQRMAMLYIVAIRHDGEVSVWTALDEEAFYKHVDRSKEVYIIYESTTAQQLYDLCGDDSHESYEEFCRSWLLPAVTPDTPLYRVETDPEQVFNFKDNPYTTTDPGLFQSYVNAYAKHLLWAGVARGAEEAGRMLAYLEGERGSDKRHRHAASLLREELVKHGLLADTAGTRSNELFCIAAVSAGQSLSSL